MTTENTARVMLTAVRRLRAVYPEMTVLQAECFLLIASRPGIGQKDVAAELGADPDSSASRLLGMLSDVGYRNTEGLRLIEVRGILEGLIGRQLFLTPRGQQLMVAIKEDLAR